MHFMTQKEHHRHCAKWIKAYVEALTAGRKVYIISVPVRRQRQLQLPVEV